MIELILLHMLDDRVVAINPAQIIQLQPAREEHIIVSDKTKCVVFFADGKFLSVKETCEQIREIIGGK